MPRFLIASATDVASASGTAKRVVRHQPPQADRTSHVPCCVQSADERQIVYSHPGAARACVGRRDGVVPHARKANNHYYVQRCAHSEFCTVRRLLTNSSIAQVSSPAFVHALDINVRGEAPVLRHDGRFQHGVHTR